MIDRNTENANYKNAKIELEHIQLELNNERFNYLRHFADSYYCYHNNIIGPRGGLNTNRVLWGFNVSVRADELLQGANNDKGSISNEIRKEHIVPLKFIAEKLREIVANGNVCLNDIQECLNKHVIFATITKDEDEKLNELGLNSEMPVGFYNPGSEFYGDLFARYKKAGIKLTNLHPAPDAV